ncbi:PID-CTERM protein-sorting domain-containing protein [Pedobacter steynii]
MKKQTLIILLIVLNNIAIARAEIDPGLPGGDPDLPLDGGVSLLLAAGAVYGIKKIRQLKP